MKSANHVRRAYPPGQNTCPPLSSPSLSGGRGKVPPPQTPTAFYGVPFLSGRPLAGRTNPYISLSPSPRSPLSTPTPLLFVSLSSLTPSPSLSLFPSPSISISISISGSRVDY